jgi:phosphoribosylformylglycinamidine synthase
MELFWHGEKVADIPVDPVSEEAPILDRPIRRPAYLDTIASVSVDDFERTDNQEAFEKMLACDEVTDKAWVYEQYDSMVQTNTEKHPGSLDASVIRVKETGKALAMSSDCNTRYCYVDPFKGAAFAVLESGRNVAMSGARPLAVTDCLNFGNPENPEVIWQFAEACEGIKQACSEMETPVVSGNVSLYNETNGVSIYPTPTIAMVGVNDDENRVLRSEFREEGDSLVLVGETRGEFGGSLYMKEICGTIGGTLPDPDYAAEARLWQLVVEANSEGLLKAAKDVNVGGVAIALAKMAARSGLGVEADMDTGDGRWIFDETQSRAILEVEAGQLRELAAKAMDLGLALQVIGRVGGDVFRLNDVSLPVSRVRELYFDSFGKVIGQDL